MKEKSLTTMQKEIDNWANQFVEPYWEPLAMMTALTEEIGELARINNRIYGPKKAKTTENIKNLEEEIGDVLFSLICMANAQKIDLTVAYEKNMDKLLNRDNNRWEKNNMV